MTYTIFYNAHYTTLWCILLTILFRMHSNKMLILWYKVYNAYVYIVYVLYNNVVNYIVMSYCCELSTVSHNSG